MVMSNATLHIDPDTMVDEVPVQSVPVKSYTLTTYKAGKMVNGWLEEDGHDKRIPDPMIFNYTVGRTNKGKKPFIPFDVETKRISEEDLKAWYDKYVAKNLA
jgi:hypothetical protein